MDRFGMSCVRHGDDIQTDKQDRQMAESKRWRKLNRSVIDWVMGGESEQTSIMPGRQN